MLSNSKRKQAWYPVFFAFTVMPVLLTFVAAQSAPQRSTGPAGVLEYGVVTLCLVVGATYSLQVLSKSVGATAGKFHVMSLIALAITELAGLFSFAMYESGHKQMLLLIATPMLIDLLVILPIANRYWRGVAD